MKSINLKKLIYQNYLKTALTSIIFIEITLLILYFYVTYGLVNKSSEFILKDIRETVYSKVDDIKSNINRNLFEIERIAYLFQNEHQNFFKYYKNIELDKVPVFKKAPNGMYYKAINNGGSSLVISNHIKIDKNLENELIKTELFDDNFKLIVDNNQMISSAYFNSRHNYSRYYPFIKDIYNVFPSSYDIKKYNFYYKADLSHNPDKKVVWTDIYLDPAGQGWMISSIVPIYKNNLLEGVTGFDITIEKIVEALFKTKIPYSGSSFLINNNGEIIATTNKIDKIIGTNNNQYKYKKNEKINGTILKEKINILKHKNKELVSILKKLLSKQNYKHELMIDGKRYFIFTKYIEKTSWYIITLIKEDDVLKEVNELKRYYIGLGIFIISLIIIFYTIFFIYLYKKAQNFVKEINKPLLKIITLTKNIGKKKKLEELTSTGVTELDLLNENFNNMVKELEERTKKLIEVESKRELQEHLANIDALTGAYNRRFLTNFTESYLKIVKRERSIFSLMIIDIDDFKVVNDSYGHNTGDEILILLVEHMKNLLRENDIIVRFGGDEFIVLLPDTNQENTMNVAKKILEKTSEIRYPFEDKFVSITISIGTAEYNKNDENIETILRRADDSLYNSKHKGKNTVS